MAAITWDDTGDRLFETGVDHGVLYIPDDTGVYGTGVAWNGLTTVTESPTGAESNPQYADNMKYLNLISAEQFGATIEAFTYPDEFAQCDGLIVPVPGLQVGQQGRHMFGFCYRSKIGNDVTGQDFGYRLHLWWGCQAAPSEKAYATVNDSPAAINFSWAITATPVSGISFNNISYAPIASMSIDSTAYEDSQLLEDVLLALYGSESVPARLPLPSEILALLASPSG